MYRRIKTALQNVPNSNHSTEALCDKFSGYLQVDAKYLSVAGKKMAFIWALDYYTHDIIWYELVPKENSQAYLLLFERIRSSNYQLKCLVCDEHKSILHSVNQVFTNASVQICITHYKRNIKHNLDLRQDVNRHFYKDISELLNAKSMKSFSRIGRKLLEKYSSNEQLRSILIDIQRKEAYLTTKIKYGKCPATTNLIECYNKHLDVRVRKLNGFKSYQHARLWLNAYVWMKRTTKLSCCKGKFKHLNGHIPLSFTAKDDLDKVYRLN